MPIIVVGATTYYIDLSVPGATVPGDGGLTGGPNDWCWISIDPALTSPSEAYLWWLRTGDGGIYSASPSQFRVRANLDGSQRTYHLLLVDNGPTPYVTVQDFGSVTIGTRPLMLPPKKGSPADVIPTLLPGVPPAGLPTDPVIPPGGTGPVNAYDAAQDLLDRTTGDRLTDYGDGWELEPALPSPGTVVLDVRHGVNLISADSVVDIDASDHAQQVALEYDWPRLSPPSDPAGTVYEDGSVAEPTWTMRAVSAPSHGRHTMIVRRSNVPASHAIAQIAADRLGARAWLRGRTLDVTTTLCAWVRPRHTVRVRLPWAAEDRLYWVASVTHDSAAATSSMSLRQFTLDDYPSED